MNIKPLADRVLVLPAQAEEKVGGIIIPDTAKEKPQHGTIVAAGNGTKDEEMERRITGNNKDGSFSRCYYEG